MSVTSQWDVLTSRELINSRVTYWQCGVFILLVSVGLILPEHIQTKWNFETQKPQTQMCAHTQTHWINFNKMIKEASISPIYYSMWAYNSSDLPLIGQTHEKESWTQTQSLPFVYKTLNTLQIKFNSTSYPRRQNPERHGVTLSGAAPVFSLWQVS